MIFAVETPRSGPIEPQLAVPADAAGIAALYAAGGWRPQSHSSQELAGRLARGEVAVVHREGRVVASVAVTWDDEARWREAGHDATAGYVHALVRDRERTAPGLGEELLGWAERRIATRGRRLSRLDTQTGATRLVRYYEDHGYRVVGSVALPDHSPLTLFEKSLGPGHPCGRR